MLRDDIDNGVSLNENGQAVIDWGIRLILEIPHQHSASAWIAWNTDEFLNTVAELGYDEDHEDFGELNPVSAFDWIRRDLHTAFMFEGPNMIDDMQKFIEEYRGHQWALAVSIIREEIKFFTGKNDGMGEEEDE
tara:strand:- start:2351 stop:2752 length:402 start_codon:yes stop_codon:yes gene_type:complete